jgi:hypothetical protein
MLCGHLDERPERARACLAKIFEEALDEEGKEALGELDETERGLVSAVKDGIGAVASVLVVPEESEYTLDELSALVFDPLPAPVTVRVPGEVLEVEGFAGTGQVLSVPELRLWSALAGIEGRWIEPDLALAYVAALRRVKRAPFDLEGFLARPRRATDPPDASEVALVIEQNLVREPIYRVRWATSKPAPGETEPESWRDVEIED